ncbi:hypothetical protein Q4F19_16730 [Sphingomonas sp. BIUV-7]|uniref:Uncharacterized protein n=1 Tax=Sphingomonas natans TaxID=3063330 RepID=A0ABT8YDM1_9SPHN|nr:hypothetical protein [Sphingomonas sp. BIUV-7]MDO6416037.1 hypothetical protein [Sphingomonas sp. BIUV-7]
MATPTHIAAAAASRHIAIRVISSALIGLRSRIGCCITIPPFFGVNLLRGFENVNNREAVFGGVESDSSRADARPRAYRVNIDMLALVALLTGAFFVSSAQSLAVARRRPNFALLACSVPHAV